MKINGLYYNYNSPVFGSKKHSVQKADEIQRQTRRAFPMLSPTYIDNFYHIKKYGYDDRLKATRISDKIHSKIMTAREMEKFPQYYGINQSDFEKDTPYALILSIVRDLKLGNCQENAKAAVAVLCANGYLNTKRANLYLQIDMVNKHTGEVEYTERAPLDHSFAITDMNTEDDLNIVVDPWLGFADTKDKAIAKFKSMYDERDFYEPRSYCRYRFFLSKHNRGEEVATSDYDVKTKMVIVPIESFDKEKLENLGYYTQLINKRIKTDN